MPKIVFFIFFLYTLTSKNFGPINFGHKIFGHKIFGRNIRKFRTKFWSNFKSVQIFSDNHFYSRISFLNEYISDFLLLMSIESLKTKRFHMEGVILQTRWFHMERVLDFIHSYETIWVVNNLKSFHTWVGALPKTFSVKIGCQFLKIGVFL